MSGRLLGAALTGALLAVLVGSAACGRRATTIAAADDVPEDQWSRGVWLYGQHCAGCHGDDGTGDDSAPAIAGDGALASVASEGSTRQTTFDSAADVFAYVKGEMPTLDPGSLTDDQYWAVVAYVLKQAQIPIGDDPLDGSNARSVALR